MVQLSKMVQDCFQVDQVKRRQKAFHYLMKEKSFSPNVVIHFFTFLKLFLKLQWHSDKEPSCQCRRHRFDPWVRKIPWRRKWQPTPLFLPGKPHGQRNLSGYSLWCCKESDITKHASEQRQLIYNVVLVLGVQQSESIAFINIPHICVYICIYICFLQALSHYRLLNANNHKRINRQ